MQRQNAAEFTNFMQAAPRHLQQPFRFPPRVETGGAALSPTQTSLPRLAAYLPTFPCGPWQRSQPPKPPQPLSLSPSGRRAVRLSGSPHRNQAHRRASPFSNPAFRRRSHCLSTLPQVPLPGVTRLAMVTKSRPVTPNTITWNALSCLVGEDADGFPTLARVGLLGKQWPSHQPSVFS